MIYMDELKIPNGRTLLFGHISLKDEVYAK